MSRICISIALIAVLAQQTCEATILSPLWWQTTEPANSVNQCKCVCGLNWNSRIVNGERTSFYEFPWAVQVKYDDEFEAGGSLISSKHVLSAAHAFYGKDENFYTFHLANGETYRMKEIILHPGYDHRNKNNDIAIVELDRPVQLGGDVRTVCLPHSPMSKYIGMTGVTIGWGRIGEGLEVSQDLRKVKVPIMSKEECLQSGYSKDRFTENMFCAGYLEGERDSCHGDSGGPLLVRNDAGAMEVVGIVSFGRGCARPNFPGAYTKVTNYLDWIKKNLHNECLCSPPAN